MAKVYARVDDLGRVLAVSSDIFLPDTDGWTMIDEGEGDQFVHAQGNYLTMPLTTAQGIPRYKLADGKVIPRSEAEMTEDVEALPRPNPTAEELIRILLGGAIND